MSLLSAIGIGTAYAASTAPAHSPESGFLSMLPMLIIFIAVFYFLLVRPQTKRAKQHRELMEQLTLGDEVSTASGIVGKITKLRDNFVVVAISKGVEVTFQKSAIANVLPKGTIESFD